MTILKNGHKTLIEFSEAPALAWEEKSVTPPSLDGGDAVDTTTMRNDTVRTSQPRTLISMGDASVTAAYDPIMYSTLLTMINVNQLITITEPDGSTVEFWGWLRTFTPNEHTEGEQPTAVYAISCGNEDDNGDETLPVYTPPA